MWADQCDCIFHDTNVYPCFHEHGGGKERAPLMKPSSGQNLAWQSLPNARFLIEQEIMTILLFLILFFSKKQDWTGRAQGWYDEVFDFNSTYVDGWQPR